MSYTAEAQERGCYCGLWDTAPGTLEAQGLPVGYCGKCRCGKPGHTRHFPGTSPTTGTWCDAHYRRTLWLHPMGFYGKRVWIGLAVVAVVLWSMRHKLG